MKLGKTRTVLLGAVAVAILTAQPARATEQTRRTMRGIFAAFATLVGHADDAASFADPSGRKEILGALRTLGARIDELDGGGGLTDAHLSARRSLSNDVAASIDALVVGRLEGARFLIGQMTESCFACHSKLPSGHVFDLGAQLLETPPISEMTLGQRAMIAVAARQFDTSLQLHEKLLRDSSHSAVEIALSGALESYLKVALRVREEPARAIAALTEFRARSDLPRYLAGEIDAWTETLRAKPAADAAPPLERARRLIREGRMQTTYPGSRRGLVNFVLASRDLNQHLQTQPDDRLEVSETFYWLGLCEVHISPSLWVSEAEDFLEQSIRRAPESNHAHRAYAALEALWIEGFSGSSGTHLPVEIERRLESLRALIDAARGSANSMRRRLG